MFTPGEGLPGRVWEERAARWVPDVLHAVETPRSASAAREGVRSALAFPVESQDQVLGVMEFFGAEARAPDQDLIDLLSGIGSQVGQFVLRREAEREVRASEARKSAIVNAALDCIVSIDAEGRITEFNPAAEATFGYTRDDALGAPVADLLIPDRLRASTPPPFSATWRAASRASSASSSRRWGCAPTARSSRWS